MDTIHLYLEVKPDSLEEWVNIGRIPCVYNEALFAIISGKGRFGFQLLPTRSLPEDCTFDPETLVDNDDSASYFGYLTMQDISGRLDLDEIYGPYSEQDPERKSVDQELDAWYILLSMLPCKEKRLVYWFTKTQ